MPELRDGLVCSLVFIGCPEGGDCHDVMSLMSNYSKDSILCRCEELTGMLMWWWRDEFLKFRQWLVHSEWECTRHLALHSSAACFVILPIPECVAKVSQFKFWGYRALFA